MSAAGGLETDENSICRHDSLVIEAPRRVLALYLEPAPYIVGLVKQVREIWRGDVDVLYVAEKLTQDWGYRIGGSQDRVLPVGLGKASHEVRRRLVGGGYDLLHLAGWGHPILLVSMLLGRLSGTAVSVESDTPRPPISPLWKRAAKRLLYPPLFRLPAVFLPAGTRQAAYLRTYGVDNTRMRVAQMTVDIGHIQRYARSAKTQANNMAFERYRIVQDSTIFLYVGRLEPYKGVLDLLEAFRCLSRMRTDVTLLIAGDGSLRTDVLAAEAANSSVRYLGHLAGDAVWEAYSLADVLVLPSRTESWGLVVNEAMAAGLPVIVSNHVGCADDLAKDGVTGLVVPAASPQELTNAMEGLADAPGRRALMGAKAAKLISGWTLRNQADRTVAAWRHALT